MKKKDEIFICKDCNNSYRKNEFEETVKEEKRKQLKMEYWEAVLELDKHRYEPILTQFDDMKTLIESYQQKLAELETK